MKNTPIPYSLFTLSVCCLLSAFSPILSFAHEDPINLTQASVPQDCSRHSSVHFKTTLNESDIALFESWKSQQMEGINTSATRKLEFERLQQYYCTGQRDIYKALRDMSWEATTLATTSALTYLCSKLMNRPTAMAHAVAPALPVDGAPVAQLPQMGYAQQSALVVFGAAFQAFASSTIKSFRESKMDLNEGLKYVHAILKEQSAEVLKSLPQDIQQKIQSFDRTATTLLAQNHADVAFKLLKRREQVYLAFPTKTLNISHRDKNGDPEVKRILDHRVQDLINRYPDDQQPALQLLISAIRDNSISIKGNRVQAYLYGPPGTGKTTFVKQLAEVLGIPMCFISMSSLEPSQLLGLEYSDDYFGQADEVVLGKIASCFIESGFTNPLIFFDEAGEYLSDSTSQSAGFDLNALKRQQIQGEFKKITDPSSSLLDNKGLGIKLDTSRATFLFASNYPLTNAALLSRITQISLSLLTKGEKTTAALGSLEQSLCEKGEFLPEWEIEGIRKIALEYLPYIVDEDEKRNPGARTVQAVIQEFINQVEFLQEQERTTGNSMITDELLKQRILGSFERREPIPTQTSVKSIWNSLNPFGE